MINSRKLLPCALAIGVAAASPSFAQSDELFPPNAKPGGCYARVFVPPAYTTETTEVLKRDGYERLEIIPAKYTWEEQQVMVKGPSTRLEVVPATFEWVEENVLVKEASSELEQIPAEYGVETERVLDTPEHTVWKKGKGPIERVDNGTGEIMCLVNVPATYKTISRRVLKSPATTREVEIPAVYKTVRSKVMKTPPSTREVPIPAVYNTVKVKKNVSPPQVRRIAVPPQYQTVSNTKMVADGKMEWRSLLCQTNMTRTTVSAIQRALSTAGYDPGSHDGVIGSKTKAALHKFQRARNLPSGQLTLETIEALGVNIGSL